MQSHAIKDLFSCYIDSAGLNYLLDEEKSISSDVLPQIKHSNQGPGQLNTHALFFEGRPPWIQRSNNVVSQLKKIILSNVFFKENIIN